MENFNECLYYALVTIRKRMLFILYLLISALYTRLCVHPAMSLRMYIVSKIYGGQWHTVLLM